MNQNTAPTKLFFASDYMEGAHPLILQRLMETNLLHTAGYGTDEFSESARVKIRKACDAPDAESHCLIRTESLTPTPSGAAFRVTGTTPITSIWSCPAWSIFPSPLNSAHFIHWRN